MATIFVLRTKKANRKKSFRTKATVLTLQTQRKRPGGRLVAPRQSRTHAFPRGDTGRAGAPSGSSFFPGYGLQEKNNGLLIARVKGVAITESVDNSGDQTKVFRPTVWRQRSYNVPINRA